MRFVGVVPVSFRDAILLKARNPRLVQRLITVHGPSGPYQRQAWVLPGDEKTDAPPKRAQFDLFDQGVPSMEPGKVKNTDKPKEEPKKPDPDFQGFPVKNLDQFKQGEWPIPKNEWDSMVGTEEAVEKDGKKYVLYLGNSPGEKYWGETRVSDHSRVKVTPQIKGKVNKFLKVVSGSERHTLSEERKAEIDGAISPKVVEALIEMVHESGGKDENTDRNLDRAARSVHPFFAWLNHDRHAVSYLAGKILGRAPGTENLGSVHYKKGEDAIKALEGLKSSARARFGGKDAGFFTMSYLDSFDQHIDGMIKEISTDVVNKNGIFRTRDKDHEAFTGSPDMDPDVRKLFNAYSEPVKKSLIGSFRSSLSKAFGTEI